MDGPPRVVGEVAHGGARECTHPWNPALPTPALRYLCDPQCCVLVLEESAGPALVFRPSTSAEVPHFFAGLEHGRRRDFPSLSHLAVDQFKLSLHPSHARDFNLPVLCDPENRWHIG